MLLGELREEIGKLEYKIGLLSESIDDSMTNRDLSNVQDNLKNFCEELKNKKLLLQDLITKVSIGEEGNSSQLSSLIELVNIKADEINLYKRLLLTSHDKGVIIEHLFKLIDEYKILEVHIKRAMWTTAIGKEE